MSKIFGQINGFHQLGYHVDFICFNDDFKVSLITYDIELQKNKVSLLIDQPNNNILQRRYSLIKASLNYLKENKIDFLYLRYPRSEPLFLYFLYQVKQNLPNCIILSEFPTYPYDEEYKRLISFKEKIVHFLDKVTRNYLKNFINKIVSINYNKPIYGIDVISIDNGIDINKYSPIIDSPKKLDIIQIICVANASYWHGLDRVLLGLNEYYSLVEAYSPKVYFHIVSPPTYYIDELRKISNTKNLSHCVFFHGSKKGMELDSLFLECHLAIGVLGGHRKGLKIMSPLKNREYCARGVPFVFSHTDPDFSEDFEYCLKIDSCDNPLNIQMLIEYANKLSTDKEIPNKMRNYAYKNLDWSVKLKPVQTYLVSAN